MTILSDKEAYVVIDALSLILTSNDVDNPNFIMDSLYDLESYNVDFVDRFIKSISFGSIININALSYIDAACKNIKGLVHFNNFSKKVKNFYIDLDVTSNCEDRRMKYGVNIVDSSYRVSASFDNLDEAEKGMRNTLNVLNIMDD